MSTIIIKNSANSGSIPLSLVQGEFAINVLDGKLFYGSGSNNNVKEFGVTASYALTSSYAERANSSSYALTASYVANASSFPYTGSAIITGSLIVTGSTISTGGFTGSLRGTSSWASNSVSSSYVTSSNVFGPFGSNSILYAVTASYALNAVSTAVPGNSTASFTASSTWNFNHNLSASLVVIQTFDNAFNQIIPQNIALTDNYNAVITFPQAVSGYAIASLGGNVGNTGSAGFPYTGSAEIIGSLAVTGSISSTQGFTGSLEGTSSYALTASYALNGGGTGLPPRFILSGSESTIIEGVQAYVYDIYNYGTLTLQAGSVSLPLGLIFITNDPLLAIESVLYNEGVINNGGVIQYLN
jgi:hypothetical protein